MNSEPFCGGCQCIREDGSSEDGAPTFHLQLQAVASSAQWVSIGIVQAVDLAKENVGMLSLSCSQPLFHMMLDLFQPWFLNCSEGSVCVHACMCVCVCVHARTCGGILVTSTCSFCFLRFACVSSCHCQPH